MEDLSLKGHIHIVVNDADGKIVAERDISNVIVTVGKTYLATWLAANSQAGKFMSWIGLGSGTTPANASNTTLETPLDDRLEGTLSSASNVWENVCVFPAGESTGTVSEAGLFSAVTSGTMLAHQVFTPIPKGAADVLTLTWSITLS